jgi:hypothetical protein
MLNTNLTFALTLKSIFSKMLLLSKSQEEFQNKVHIFLRIAQVKAGERDHQF